MEGESEGGGEGEKQLYLLLHVGLIKCDVMAMGKKRLREWYNFTVKIISKSVMLQSIAFNEEVKWHINYNGNRTIDQKPYNFIGNHDCIMSRRKSTVTDLLKKNSLLRIFKLC